VNKQVPWPEDQRNKARGVLEDIRRSINKGTVTSDKPDFDGARSDFQSHYTVKDILDGKPGKNVRL